MLCDDMDAEQTLNNTRIEERHWWFAARRKIVRDVLRDLVPASKDALIIDIGCGTGGNSGALSDEYRCVGIDSSKEAVDFATTRHPHAHFIRGEVPRDLGPLVREARAFFLMDVLEHVHEEERPRLANERAQISRNLAAYEMRVRMASRREVDGFLGRVDADAAVLVRECTRIASRSAADVDDQGVFRRGNEIAQDIANDLAPCSEPPVALFDARVVERLLGVHVVAEHRRSAAQIPRNRTLVRGAVAVRAVR